MTNVDVSLIIKASPRFKSLKAVAITVTRVHFVPTHGPRRSFFCNVTVLGIITQPMDRILVFACRSMVAAQGPRKPDKNSAL